MRRKREFREFRELVREVIADPERAAGYLSEAAKDEDRRVFLTALKDVVDVHGGLSELARKARLNRGNLHRALSGASSPGFATVSKVLETAGFEIAIVPKASSKVAPQRSRPTRHSPSA